MQTVVQTIHDLLVGDVQNKRILRVSFPHDDGPDAQLLANQLDAVESLSRDFEYRVELLSDNATLALKEMQGKLLNIELIRQDARTLQVDLGNDLGCPCQWVT